ncbi:NAD(P)H-dependent oxidoreductase [Lewinella sp. IMCC34191]|uniref:NAD(P)H-dependent oxidoreductase n=1 Tax=Lewinella sp. IMCC34191 TaxID=2259172 RepID=UPI000E24983E|nr:NAD(P)H-dependent oxidoreductase [Lewinella sp. IMCC34191]
MNILVIYGHPDPESFSQSLADAYADAAAEGGGKVRRLQLHQLDFNPNLRFGYRKRTELEPDLLRAQEDLSWADHLVWVYPVWWGSVPALLKGFLDRVFLPGFAFTKRENSLWWDKNFTGKTSRIICTMDQPPWFYRLRYGRPSTRAMREVTLQFIGVKRVRTTAIGPVRLSQAAWREEWLAKIRELGRRGK